jgi:hypothetical protein
MSQRLARLILLLLAFASPAPAAFTAALDPVIAVILDRRAAITPPTPDQRREYRALGRAAREFAAASGSLADDLAVTARAARRMDGDFRTDPEILRLMAVAVDELVAAAEFERARLALWTGRLDTPARESSLARGLDAARRDLDRAAARGPNVARARLAGRGCRHVDRTRADLGLAGDPPPPDPTPQMPDFALTDVNPASTTSGTLVSPRDYVDEISAWYFGKAG